jgi:hypothetical protein
MIPMINNSDLKNIIINFNLIQFKYKIKLEKTNLLNVSLVANFAFDVFEVFTINDFQNI